jgi:hypothetical protein
VRRMPYSVSTATAAPRAAVAIVRSLAAALAAARWPGRLLRCPIPRLRSHCRFSNRGPNPLSKSSGAKRMNGSAKRPCDRTASRDASRGILDDAQFLPSGHDGRSAGLAPLRGSCPRTMKISSKRCALCHARRAGPHSAATRAVLIHTAHGMQHAWRSNCTQQCCSGTRGVR